MFLETSAMQAIRPTIEDVLDVPATARWIVRIAGNVLADSEFLDGSNRINIRNGRFDGDSNPIKDSNQMEEKLGQALFDIAEARSVILKALDNAMQIYNFQRSGEASIRTISFDSDIAPRLTELLQLTTNRWNSLEQKQIDTLQSAYEKLRKSFNSIDNPNEGLEVKPKWATKHFSGTVKIATFHLKSKSGGRNDPTGYQWETTRMESAEKLREFLLTNDKSSFETNGPILVALGDRNSEPDTASAKILEGTIHLSAFQENGTCQLSKKSRPLCNNNPSNEQTLYSVLTSDPDTRDLPGTHHYKKSMSWLDDILMPKQSLPYALEKPSSEGDYESGVIDEPSGASDHALVFVRLAL